MPKRFGISLNGSTSIVRATTTSGGLPETDMILARATIVNELWRALNSNVDAESAPSASLMASFEEQRCPQVQHGQLSAAEMEQIAIDAMVDSETSTVSKHAFFQFHANLLSAFPDHTDREVTLLLRWIWKLNQPDTKFRTLRKDELGALTKELFATSAYHGQKFQTETLVDDSVDRNLGTDGMSKLDPFPMPKPGHLAPGTQGHFYSGVTVLHHKTRLLRNGDETVKNHPEFTGEPHTAGVVATVPKSLGFLDTESHNKGYGGGSFDDTVIDAVRRGKEEEQEIARRRAEVLMQPYATANPPHFKTTAQMEHLDFSRVVDRTADPAVLTSAKEWTQHTREIRGPRGLRPAGDGKTASDALPQSLVQKEAELVAHNRRAARRPPPFDASTTQREHFAPLDFGNALSSNNRWAEKPTLHRAQMELAQSCGGSAVGSGDSSTRARNPQFETEYSSNMANPGPNKDFSAKFHHPGVLDLKHGTSQMKTKWHHPREAPLGDADAELRASTVAPRQFATTSRHFFAHQKY